MSAYHVAELAPLIREVFAAASGDPAETDWCATFEVVGNALAWAQVTATHLNLAYPYKDPPAARLSDVISQLPGAALTSWEPDQFATFEFRNASASVVARVCDRALSRLFGLSDYSVDGTLERV